MEISLQHLEKFLDYEFFRYHIYGNSSFDWLVSLVIIIGSILLSRFVYWFLSKVVKTFTAKTKSKLDDILIDMCEKPMLCAIILGGLWWGLNRLAFPPKIDHAISLIYKVAVALNTTWFVALLAKSLIKEYLEPLSGKQTQRGGHKIDVHIISVVQKTLIGLIWILGGIAALNNAGVNVSALLAGLGIGGIAFALAAQDTVKNIFGGITIFTDKPFRIGDVVNIGGMTGTVEDIGLRSIRLRTLQGRLITIPNYKTVDSNVENITLEPSRRIDLNLGLTYDTTPEKMQLAMEILRAMPDTISDIDKTVQVYFSAYGDFAMNIACFYFIKKKSDIFETQSVVNLHILTEFNKNKIDFAFPTQTIYLNKN